jgi:antitoxin CptB
VTTASNQNDNIETRRKRARFRAWHRGMREMDFVLGGFADREMATMTAGELAEFEALLHESDAEFLDWIAGRKPVPEHLATPLFARIAASANAAR